MAGQDAHEIVVAGGGAVFVAPVNTTMPTNPTTALNASFRELGYHTEDGVTFRDVPTTEGIRAWQSYYDVRRFTTAREASIGMTLHQWNEDTFALYFGGGTTTSPVAGVYKFEPPEPGADPYQRAVVIEFSDGSDRNFRICAPTVELQESTEVTLNKGASAGLALTLTVLGSDTTAAWWMLTDDFAFDPAGS
jgi:hypothetical protein